MRANVDTIAVIGAGMMGAGIAQLAATHRCTVHLVDVSRDALNRGIDGIKKRLGRSVEKGKTSASDRDAIVERIRPGNAIGGLENVGLAIEAVVEDLAVKREVLRQLDTEAPQTAVLATNTSSLSVTEIAKVVSDPSRVVGMHFFNPAPIMPLVELIAGEASSESSIDVAFKVAKSWGKTVVRAKDTPGFIVNRVARGFYLEALRLAGEGVAGVGEIDHVTKTLAGFRMGPFELMDLVGLDVNLSVSTSVWERMDRHPRFEPHEIQKRLVEEGHLGRKSGRGFYLYGDRIPIPASMVDRRSFELTPLLGDAMLAFTHRAGAVNAGSTEQYILARILGAIINEAGHSYSDGVAGSDDIDLAMQKGAGYPKGPLAWADEIGHRTIRGLLTCLNGVCRDRRYEPSALFTDAR